MTPFHAHGQPRVFRIQFGSTPRSRVLLAGPATDVQGPVWVDCYSPAPGWRMPPGYSPYSPLFSNYSPTTPRYSPPLGGEYCPGIRRILHYSPIILQPHPVGILQVFSRAPQAAAGCHKGASGGRMAPRGAARRLEPLIGANRRSLAQISSNQLCLVQCKGRRQGAAGNFREFPEASCGAPPPTLALSQTQLIRVIIIIIIIKIISIMYNDM